jgi:hypothetical protein
MRIFRGDLCLFFPEKFKVKCKEVTGSIVGFENLWNKRSVDLHNPSVPQKVIRVVKPRTMERGRERDMHGREEKFLQNF